MYDALHRRKSPSDTQTAAMLFFQVPTLKSVGEFEEHACVSTCLEKSRTQRWLLTFFFHSLMYDKKKKISHYLPSDEP